MLSFFEENGTDFKQVAPFQYFNRNSVNFKETLNFFISKGSKMGKLSILEMDEKGRSGLMRSFLFLKDSLKVLEEMIKIDHFKERMAKLDRNDNSLFHYLVYYFEKSASHSRSPFFNGEQLMTDFVVASIKIFLDQSVPITKNKLGNQFLFFNIIF